MVQAWLWDGVGKSEEVSEDPTVALLTPEPSSRVRGSTETFPSLPSEVAPALFLLEDQFWYHSLGNQIASSESRVGILGLFFDRKVRGFEEKVAGRKSACEVYAVVWDLQPKS